MKRLLAALLCAAPLMANSAVEPAQTAAPEPVVPVAEQTVAVPMAEPVYYSSMGCTLTDCTDPTHYHYCLEGCTDQAHYHNCRPGCVDTTHGHYVDCPAQPAFCASMGCTLAGCTDPTHYHYCAEGCTDPAHYHNCQPGCVDTAHGHGYSQGHHGSRGHHRGHH